MKKEKKRQEKQTDCDPRFIRVKTKRGLFYKRRK
jgi:hypothetical protein